MDKEKTEKKEQKEETKRYSKAQVATETQDVIIDSENKDQPISQIDLLVRMANNQEEILKVLK